MKLKVFIAIILTFFLGAKCFAQSEKIEKYKEELSTASSDSAKASLNYRIALQYRKSDYDKAMDYVQKSRTIAKEGGLLKLEANSLQLIGLIHKYQGNYSEALNYYNKSHDLHEKVSNKSGMALALNNIGVVYKNVGKLDSALYIYDRAEEIHREIDNPSGLAQLDMNRGVVMKHKGAYEEAAEYYLRALKVYEEEGNLSSITRCYNNIGVLYRLQGLPDQAMEYYRKALKLSKEKGADWQVAKGYSYMGAVYSENYNKPDSALYFYNKSLEINKKLGDKNSLCNVYANIALNYRSLDNYDKSLEYMLKAHELSQVTGNRMIGLFVTSNLGELYSFTGDHEKALDYLYKALKLAKESQEIKEYMLAHKKLAYVYKRMGRAGKAFDYLKQYYSIKDSLMGNETKSRIAELQTMYESEKQENEIAMLRKKEELQKLALRKKEVTNYAFMGGLTLVLVLAFIIFRSYRQKKKHALVLEDQNQAINLKNAIIEEKNKDVMDSIKYAKRLQEAILPPIELVTDIFPASFILYKPKDIVSGDFYWVSRKSDHVLFAAVDCTGHGVPGAFMSIVGYNGLNNAVNDQKLVDPAKILNSLNETVSKTLNQEKKEAMVKDGMDAALCYLDKDNKILHFSGAMNPLYIVRNGELIEVKGDKHPIGAGKSGEHEMYSKHELYLEEGDCIYIFTDGFADQFGGDKGKKFKYRPFKNLLLEIQEKPMSQQKEILNATIEDWRGELEQVDDICVFGVRI